MELEDHINKLKIAYQAFKEVEGLTDMTICDMAKQAHEQYSLDKRTEYIWAERAKSGGASGMGSAVWRDNPATDKQKDYLRQRGMAIADNITKGQASDMIESMSKGGK